jgi:hypothetical protein
MSKESRRNSKGMSTNQTFTFTHLPPNDVYMLTSS